MAGIIDLIRSHRALTFALIMLPLFKLWLVSFQTMSAKGWMIVDDYLYVRLANNIVTGSWLGEYDIFTLAKSPFYSLWIAINFLSGVPLLLSQHLLYIAACSVFIVAIRPLIQKPTFLFLTFAVLLFNPMSYSAPMMTRFFREGIYPALVILTVSSAIGYLSRRDQPVKSLWVWSVGLGLSFSAFWLTREEGLWLLPSVIFIILFASMRAWFGGIDRFKKLTLCVLPFIIWILSLSVISSVNKVYYGVFTVSDIKSRSFLAAMGALMRVKHTNWHPMIPVPRETRREIYAVSPSFAELTPFLEGSGDIFASCKVISICDDIGGGWFSLAFRRAVGLAGYNESAKATENYHQRLATEVNSACNDGRLDCGPKRISTIPPWHSEYVKPLLKSIYRGAVFLTTFQSFSPFSERSSGPDESLDLFKKLSREQIAPQPSLVITGWAFSPQNAANLSIHRGWKEEKVDYTLRFLDSPDLHERFSIHENAKMARFEIKSNCYEECFVYIKTGDTIIEKLPIKDLEDNSHIVSRPDLLAYIETVIIKEQNGFPNRNRMAMTKAKYLTQIATIYQYLSPFAMVLALAFYAAASLNGIRIRGFTVLYIINTSIIIAIFSRLLILSMIDISLFPTIDSRYLSPAYPLLLMLIMLSLFGYKSDRNLWIEQAG